MGGSGPFLCETMFLTYALHRCNPRRVSFVMEARRLLLGCSPSRAGGLLFAQRSPRQFKGVGRLVHILLRSFAQGLGECQRIYRLVFCYHPSSSFAQRPPAGSRDGGERNCARRVKEDRDSIPTAVRNGGCHFTPLKLQ